MKMKSSEKYFDRGTIVNLKEHLNPLLLSVSLLGRILMLFSINILFGVRKQLLTGLRRIAYFIYHTAKPHETFN